MQALNLRTRASSGLLSQISHQPTTRHHSLNLTCTRSVSNSPYGRTHVWKRRPPVLPNPVVPKFPQTIIRTDGTSFIQWTTSPKSLVRLTRDTTNNPVWNTAAWASERSLEEEIGSTGRLGRFSRRFGGVTMPKEEMSKPDAPAESEEKGAGKKGEKPLEAKKDVEEGMGMREDMVDLTGGMGMGKANVGMGGVLDDVSWFEQMADLTGGETKAPGKGKKKKKD